MSCSIIQQPGNQDTEDWKFPVAKELQGRIRPSDKSIKKFIRDCVACLQAYHGTAKVSPADCLSAARRIVQKVPLLADPKPPSFPTTSEFPYWVCQIFLINYFHNR